MIARVVRFQLLAFVVLTMLGVSYVGANYVGFFKDSYTVVAAFEESGGIFPNAEVTYRGVPVGEVGELRLSPGGVDVLLEIDEGRQIPSDATATVANRSAIGEQYVDLEPESRGAPYLEDGDRIHEDRTDGPIQTAVMLRNLDQLVNSVGKDDLVTVVDELGTAFEGTGPNLQRLIDSGDALTRSATRALPETVRLLEDGETVLRTQNEQAGHIKSFARDLALLTGTLRNSDPDLRKVIDNGTTAGREFEDFIRTNDENLAILFGNLTTLGQISKARLPGMEQVLVTYPVVVAGGFTVTPGDNTAHFGLVLNSDPPPCQQGYEGTDRHPGEDDARADRDPVNENAHCEESSASGANVRGAQNAPKAGSAGGGSSSGSPGGSSGGPFEEPQGVPQPAPPGHGGKPSGTFVAGYDPITGRAIGPDGQPIVIGSHGGQQSLLGEDSWQWLLLGPLGG
ncbi:MAG: MlaD family protein [Streptomycetales bacterium]